MFCKLCFSDCEEYNNLYDDYGQQSEVYKVTSKYFFKQLENNMEISTKGCKYSRVLCVDCWTHIKDFNNFEDKILTVHIEYDRLMHFEDIKLEMEVDNEVAADLVQCEFRTDNIVDKIADPVGTLGEENIHLPAEELSQIFDKKKVEVDSEDDKPLKQRVRSRTKATTNTKPKPANKKTKKLKATRKRKTVRKSETNENDKQSVEAQQRAQKILEEDAFIGEHWKTKLNCDLCKENFETYTALRVHFRTAHNTRDCYVICCEKKFHHRFLLIEHLRLHMNPAYYACKECGKCCRNSRTLANHMKTVHAAQPAEKKYECEVCGKRFAKKAILRGHLDIHATGSKDYVCPHCNKGFILEHRLNIHIKHVHSKVVSVCETCGKSFRGTYAIKAHLLEHEPAGKRKWPCDQCNAELHSKFSLKRHHRLAHNDGSTVYICSQCGKVALNEHALRAHKRNVHERERKFKCNICEKAFKVAKVLREHMASHTGEDLYKCPHCTRRFKVSANLHHHRKRAHPKEWEENRLRRTFASSVDLSTFSKEVVI